MFNAPWPVLTLAVGIVALYYLQSRVAGQEALFLTWGLVPADLMEGRWITLLTSMGLHGGWAHAALNAIGALAFGAPVARLLGLSLGRAILFFFFFLACGVAAGWGYAWLHADSATPLVGASGGVSGLMGAAARLLDRGDRRLNPMLSSTVVGMTAAWLAVNLIVGVVGFAPGSGGAAIAWEAHIAGYLCGLLLIGPLAMLFARRSPPSQAIEAELPDGDADGDASGGD
jgi:membrane associated rhomboid family serine protease